LKTAFENKNLGQTLVEILVGLSVVAILSSLLVLYSRTGELQTSLLRESEKLVLNIRRAQDLALLAQEFKGTGRIPCGYGVHFDADAREYYLFADLAPAGEACAGNADRIRAASGAEDLEVIRLEAGLKISARTASDIVFVPPEPTTIITPPAAEAVTTLTIVRQPSLERQIKVTSAGQVTIISQ